MGVDFHMEIFCDYCPKTEAVDYLLTEEANAWVRKGELPRQLRDEGWVSDHWTIESEESGTEVVDDVRCLLCVERQSQPPEEEEE